MAGRKLDPIDRQILAELQADGRMTNVELAKPGRHFRAALPAPRADAGGGGLHPGLSRRHRRARTGVRGAGLRHGAACTSQAEADLSAFEARCRAWPLVRECHMLNGEIDFILKCVAPDLSTFQSFLTEQLTAAPNIVASVKTSLVIRCAKDEPRCRSTSTRLGRGRATEAAPVTPPGRSPRSAGRSPPRRRAWCGGRKRTARGPSRCRPRPFRLADAGGPQPVEPEARQVEAAAGRRRRWRRSGRARDRRRRIVRRTRADLVGALADRRADHGADARPVRAPSRSIAASVASSTPSSAPRQPAWAAPITPASGSANSTGAQSAVSTASARPGRSP